MDTNFNKIKADPSTAVATSGTQMEAAFNGNFDKIKQNFTEHQAAIDELRYVELAISAFTGGGTYERGTVISAVNFAWAFNKTEIVTQSIAPDVPALSKDARSYNLAGQSITGNRTYTLTANDGKVTKTRQTAISIKDSRYWGVSEKATLTAAEILQLMFGELADNWAQERTFDCSGGKYFYIIGPSAWGEPRFKAGGLNFTAMQKTVMANFVNASGATVSIDVWRVQDLQTASAIPVQVLNP